MHAWEYMTVTHDAVGFFDRRVDTDRFVAELNQYGKLGWEVVSVFDTNAGQGATARVIAVLKRPK